MGSPQLAPHQWDPEVHQRLSRLLAAGPLASDPSPLAVFDWDDTVIEGDLSLSMLRTSDEAHGTRWWQDYHDLLRTGGRPVAYPQITLWYAGLRPEGFLAFTESVVHRALASGDVRFREPMVDLIHQLQRAGWDVHVVTASPELLVVPMASRLGIPRSHVHGMRLRVNPNGVMLPELDGPATFEEGKRQVIEDRLGRSPTLVAGDSSSDLPMMQIASHVLLIDGHDSHLRAEARRRGWMIQSGWTHTPAEHGVS